MTDDVKELARIIGQSSRIVAFTGAGYSTESGVPDFRSSDGIFGSHAHISTESGIPDFRSVDGLYHQQYDEPPEEILSHTYFMRRPEGFFRFYRAKMLPLDAQPNAAHLQLAALEKAGRLTAIVTQNIDGLHQKAGSKTVLELHGSIHRNHCMNCGRSYSPEFIRDSKGVPLCACGGRIKPDVVLYEEGLDEDVLAASIHHIRQADTLIIAGTSLTVYPAAGLVHYFRGKHLVLINRDATPLDGEADLVIHRKVGEVLGELTITPVEDCT